VLDRTRSSGGCDGQLDLLLLVAGDDFTTTRILADEQRRTVAACANEPTPDWIVGQAQMRDLQLTFTPRPSLTDDKTRRGLAAAISTFQALTERFPRDTAAVTGLGDAYLRAGLRLLYSEPFTARHDLRLAMAQYNRAAVLGAGHDADLGRARALVGLGESKRAVPIASQIVATSPRPGERARGPGPPTRARMTSPALRPLLGGSRSQDRPRIRRLRRFTRRRENRCSGLGGRSIAAPPWALRP
jgi:hypothetical protein